MEAENQEDIYFILGLIAGLCQFADRDGFMLAVLVEQLQAREEIASKTNRGTVERVGAKSLTLR